MCYNPFHRKDVFPKRGVSFMETGVIVAVVAVLCIAIFAVLICVFSTVSTVSGIKQTRDEDSEA